jgi:uncharacterized DUF497 family protein
MFRIAFDPRKRAKTLRERALDFADAALVFEGYTLDDIDDRFEYEEERWISVGALGDRVVIVVWTPVGRNTRRVISMRAANGEEQAEYWKRLSEG